MRIKQELGRAWPQPYQEFIERTEMLALSPTKDSFLGAACALACTQHCSLSLLQGATLCCLVG